MFLISIVIRHSPFLRSGVKNLGIVSIARWFSTPWNLSPIGVDPCGRPTGNDAIVGSESPWLGRSDGKGRCISGFGCTSVGSFAEYMVLTANIAIRCIILMGRGILTSGRIILSRLINPPICESYHLNRHISIWLVNNTSIRGMYVHPAFRQQKKDPEHTRQAR